MAHNLLGDQGERRERCASALPSQNYSPPFGLELHRDVAYPLSRLHSTCIRWKRRASCSLSFPRQSSLTSQTAVAAWPPARSTCPFAIRQEISEGAD
eukprot:scaffold322750_cov33-Tisochrysis_lutea.AAC.1